MPGKSRKQEVVKSLQSAKATCDAARDALKDLDGTFSEPQRPASAITLETLLSDFNSLLSLLYLSTTKLSIALKPSSPTYEAALTPLKDLRANIDALASCACSIDAKTFGRAIAREARWAAEDVIDSVHQLFIVFLDEASRPARSGADAKAYLARTGAVHGAIDRARDVSRSNRDAVRKRWTSDMDSLKDCINEVLEMTEDGDDVEDDGDDGWGDLDVDDLLEGNSPKPTADEMDRIHSAHKLFLSIYLLLETISSNLLSDSANLKVEPLSRMDPLLEISSALLAASDELVSTLDVPQDHSEIFNACAPLTESVSHLRALLNEYGIIPSAPATDITDSSQLSDKVASISLKASTEGPSSSSVVISLSRCLTDVTGCVDALKTCHGP